MDQILENMKQELRRGSLVLTVLLSLDTPKYGYSLVQDLEQLGIVIDQSTLYPLLRRLEKQELVTSDWSVGDSRPRKYYLISEKGIEARLSLLDEWSSLGKVIGKMKGEKGE